MEFELTEIEIMEFELTEIVIMRKRRVPTYERY